jgi:adenine-specific DNA-methyltransferase
LDYIGNKQSLVKHIHNVITKYNIEGNSICDIFAGTHAVGSYFKDKEYTVFCNDWQAYSYVFGKALIENTEQPSFETLINSNYKRDLFSCEEKNLLGTTPYQMVLNYLNSLKGIEGFVYYNYCPGGTINLEYERLYFSNENGKKCDEIRTLIEKWWKEEGLINEKEFYILLGSLINAMDAVANTTSVYGAFLKVLKSPATKSLLLKPLPLSLKGNGHKAFNEDANKLVRKIECDIFYLDPPYNSRQYASNYHVLETIALYDNPTLHGKTGLRDYDHQKSPYSSKVKAKEALKDLVHNINGKYIILSYNNEGIMTEEDIVEIFSQRGKVYKEEIIYKRFKSDKDSEKRQYNTEDNKVVEWLYILEISK